MVGTLRRRRLESWDDSRAAREPCCRWLLAGCVAIVGGFAGDWGRLLVVGVPETRRAMAELARVVEGAVTPCAFAITAFMAAELVFAVGTDGMRLGFG